MTQPNKHQLALASAKSVVRGSRQAFRWMLAGVAAFHVSSGCAESDSGTQTGDSTVAVGDTGNYSDILNDLVDIVSGLDTKVSSDVAEPSIDTTNGNDTMVADKDTSPTPTDVAENSDTATSSDATANDDTNTSIDDVAMGDDSQDQPDSAKTPDTAGEDVQAADATDEMDAGTQTSCLQPTGEPCELATDCEADWALCEDGECMEQDFSNEIAMECCQEYYASGFTGPLPKGCNPWGPPAPPAFVAANFNRRTGVA